MLSPLKPLLCRHDFYWSERHRADLCRGCGKTRAVRDPDSFPTLGSAQSPSSRVAETPAWFAPEVAAGSTTEADFLHVPAMGRPQPGFASPASAQPSARVLKAEALERRENLPALLDRIAVGGQPSRKEALDVLLALIEDGHSADPVVFGSAAVDHFARLHKARRGLIF